MRKANRTTALVTSLFPKSVANQLMDMKDDDDDIAGGGFMSANRRVKSFLTDGSKKHGMEPIAELFPFTTVMFADIQNVRLRSVPMC